ncbi:MAG: hypothetical protein LBJ21_00785 [Acidobacteriota bacterium]|nr:hypothetical protein [Acidobacteriota bacterium]
MRPNPLFRQRQAGGIAAAKARGVCFGGAELSKSPPELEIPEAAEMRQAVIFNTALRRRL